jgi:hypothetical protein
VDLEDQLYTVDHGLRVVLEAWRRLPRHTPPDRIVLQMSVGVAARLGAAGVERLVGDYANGLSVKQVAHEWSVSKWTVLRLLRTHGVETRPSGINYSYYDVSHPPDRRRKPRLS